MTTLPTALPSLLAALSPQEFLERHWQKTPLFVPKALPGYTSPISPDELAGLACEANVESRLVHSSSQAEYQLEFGPFEAARFPKLGEANWTLLVQDVDKWEPTVGRLLSAFRFIPSWRIDDIMISFATPGGSVGPHTDNYDVFLLQVAGRRRWQVSRAFDPTKLRQDTDLAVLESFSAEQEWVAGPGDMLYLPPNIAHFGVALDDCLTYSIGMRAPSDLELLRQYVQALDERGDGRGAGTDILRLQEQRYADPELGPTARPGSIDASALARLADLLRATLNQSEQRLERWIAATLSAGKPEAEGHGSADWCAEHRDFASIKALGKQCAAGGKLLANPALRCHYVELAEASYLYVDGREYALRREFIPLAQHLCDEGELSLAAVDPKASATLEWLHGLVKEGWLRGSK